MNINFSSFENRIYVQNRDSLVHYMVSNVLIFDVYISSKMISMRSKHTFFFNSVFSTFFDKNKHEFFNSIDDS